MRAHEQKDDGYKLHLWAGADAEPPVITIFSAPNYCEHENLAAILVTGSATEKARILTYYESCGNYYLPDHQVDDETERVFYPLIPHNAFTSFAYLLKEWITQIFQTILDLMNSADEGLATIMEEAEPAKMPEAENLDSEGREDVPAEETKLNKFEELLRTYE